MGLYLLSRHWIVMGMRRRAGGWGWGLESFQEEVGLVFLPHSPPPAPPPTPLSRGGVPREHVERYNDLWRRAGRHGSLLSFKSLRIYTMKHIWKLHANEGQSSCSEIRDFWKMGWCCRLLRFHSLRLLLNSATSTPLHPQVTEFYCQMGILCLDSRRSHGIVVWV